VIYFIRCGDAIKIGYSDCNPQGRLKTMQTGNPVKLELLAVTDGSETDEVAYHAHFVDLHIHGEWFRCEPKLLDFIKEQPPPKLPESRRRPQLPQVVIGPAVWVKLCADAEANERTPSAQVNWLLRQRYDPEKAPTDRTPKPKPKKN
jgi:hypothetical protein